MEKNLSYNHQMEIKAKAGSRKFTVRVWKEAEGGYGGQCLELPGAISQGETMEELKKNMAEAIQLVLETLASKAERDQKITIEIPE